MLYANEKVYDETNYRELVGNGEFVEVGGEKRLLARTPPPASANPRDFSTAFADSGIEVIPRSEWPRLIAEQIALKSRVSDYCDFPPWDQDGLPTCWANGPTQAMAIMRRIQGLPFKCLSACSVAVPISGGHSGGWEGDALKYAAKNGVASTDVWPENNTSKKLINDPAVIADRANHVALEWIDCGDDPDVWGTVCLLGMPGAFAYNWMSHVMTMCDLVETAGGYGFRVRNSWANWGAKNDHGFAGFAVYKEGRRGTPNSGFALRQVTASIA
jgi:hypothetical protein